MREVLVTGAAGFVGRHMVKLGFQYRIDFKSGIERALKYYSEGS